MEQIEHPLVAGEDDLAVQDSLGGEQVVSQVLDFLNGAAEHGHFEAMAFPEMHVQAGNDQVVMMVLLFDQPRRQFAGVMIVDEGDDGHQVPLGLSRPFSNQAVADQVANGLAARGVALVGKVTVECME
jgi:hypothetical protein